MDKIKPWQLCLINLGVFIMGQLMACYYFWVGHGSVSHGDSLQMTCVAMGFLSAFINVMLWVYRL